MASAAFLILLGSASFTAARGSSDVRLVDAAGGLSNVGLLQVKTDAGFGTVCRASAAAADVNFPSRCAHAVCMRSFFVAALAKFVFALPS